MRRYITKRTLIVATLVAGAGGPSAAHASGAPVVSPYLGHRTEAAASASAVADRAPRPVVQPNPDQQTAAPAVPRSAPATVTASAPQRGFHWRDAGVGAAATAGLMVLLLASGLALSQYRARRHASSTAAAG